MLNTVSWKHLAEQMQALEVLKSEGALKKEIEFETKLRELLDQYGFGLKHIINLLDQQTTARQKSEASIGKSQRFEGMEGEARSRRSRKRAEELSLLYLKQGP